MYSTKEADNLEWFKKKMLLAQDLEAEVTLDEEQLAFLADPRDKVESSPDTQTLPTTAIFQTDNLDAFDSNFDEAPSASAFLIAILYAYDSDVLFEDALEFLAFFEINDLKAQLQAKNTSINKLKEHIATLKGKNLQPLSPKLRKNRVAHVDHLKQTKEHADTLCEIVEQSRALKPLDNNLDYACKFTTRIQELLVYVSATCPTSRNESEKLVVVTPMNKKKQVRFAEPGTSTSNTQNRPKSGKSNKKKEWKPMGKVFTNVGHRWLPTRRNFTIDGTKRPLTRIILVPPKKPSQTKEIKKTLLRGESQGKPNATKNVIQIVLWYLDSGCSKHMTGQRSQLINFVSKFIGTVRFGNDQIAAIMSYYEDVEISHQTSVAHTPQQNDVVERQNQALVEAARTMLIFSKAPLFLWAEAITTACYTQNCSLIRARHSKTPYELLHDKKPDI
ncbi:retrovirus-related pol polyprotein from transposon TNT 1-94 [Tanacetum coccineum]